MTHHAIFMANQIQAIDEAKWLEGCRLNEDPGQPFIFDWIKDNAEEYRNKWQDSVCSKCYKNVSCKHAHKCLKKCAYL
jgi:hypothetical protein